MTVRDKAALAAVEHGKPLDYVALDGKGNPARWASLLAGGYVMLGDVVDAERLRLSVAEMDRLVAWWVGEGGGE